MDKNRLVLFCLFLILVFASFFRLYRLDKVPAGFNFDEAMVGYNAYTLNKWGMDETGHKWPLLYIQSSVTYHQSPFFYLTAVAQKFLGVSKFSLRFTPALFGVLDVFIVYFLLQQLFKKNKNRQAIGLSAALLTAASSWHIYISRSGYELTIAQFFFLAGLLCFFQQKTKLFNIIVMALLFVLSALTYRSYLIFLPLLVLCLCWFFRSDLKKSLNRYILPVFAFLFLFSSVLIAVFDPRKSDTLFAGFRRWSDLFPIVNTFLRNYIVHFSLLLNFAPTAFDPKYWMVNRGLFYLFELPLIILGLVFLFKTKHWSLRLFLPWLFLYPIPHALTDFGYANRMSVILPLPQILAGIGFWYLLKNITFKYWLLVFLIIIFSFTRFWVDYYSYYPRKYGNFNHEGPEYVFNYVQKNTGQYNRIIISRWNTHPVFFLFFGKYDLPLYLKDTKTNPILDKTQVFAKLGRIYFVNNILDVKPEEGDLFIDSPEHFPKQLHPLKIIYLLNGDEFAWLVSGREILKAE